MLDSWNIFSENIVIGELNIISSIIRFILRSYLFKNSFCGTFVYRSLSSQKRESDPVELELQVVARCHVGAGNRKGMHPLRVQNVLTAVSSLHSLGLFFTCMMLTCMGVHVYGCRCIGSNIRSLP